MIKQIILITILVYVFFLSEILINDIFGLWAKPQLLLILVVFWGLYSGIRYSLYSALVAGVLKDSFSIAPFGTYLFIFVVAAFLTIIVRKNLYQPGSRFSRAAVTFFVLLGTFIVQTLLYLRNHEVIWRDLLLNIFLPELIASMLLVTFIFHQLRNLALWFKI